MKHFIIGTGKANRRAVENLLSGRPLEFASVRRSGIVDRLSRARSLGVEVTAVIVDQLKQAKMLRKDIDDLGLETEVIEWRGDAREFEEELNRLEI